MSDVACYVVENSACDLMRSRVRVDGASLDQMERLYCWGFKTINEQQHFEHIYIHANQWTTTEGLMSY